MPLRRRPVARDLRSPALPAGGAIAFDTRSAATAAGRAAAEASSRCTHPDRSPTTVRAVFTLAPTGNVTRVQVVGEANAGTDATACIERVFAKVTVPPFDGDPVTIAKAVSLSAANEK